MSTYSVADLLHKWSIGELSTEQAIGHLLQNVMSLWQKQAEQEKRIRQLEQDVKSKS
jgi:hypothetical protein